MHPSYLTEYQRLESTREAIFELVRATPSELLKRQPQENAWSVWQIIRHLYLAETASTAYIEKKLHYRTNIPKATVFTPVRAWAAVSYLKLPLRFSAPNAVRPPVEIDEPDQLMKDWAESREHLATILREFPEELRWHGILKHPIAGRLTMLHTLRFFQAHQQRHFGQIRRTLKQLATQS